MNAGGNEVVSFVFTIEVLYDVVLLLLEMENLLMDFQQ